MITEKELERLENLPRKIGLKRDSRAKGYWWKYGKDRIYGESVWSIADRVLTFNIGRSFDLAFSYFCKRIHYRQQWYHCFLRDFDRNSRWGYYIDENNLIQHNAWHRRDTPRTHTITSSDYKSEKVYVSDGLKADRIEYNRKELNRRKEIGDKIINKVICGTFVVCTFNDPRAVRNRAEFRKKQSKLKRDTDIWGTKSKEADWVLYNKKRLAKEKEREEDRIRMEALGFDSNSFKGIEYHGQKRKLKDNE